jgi:hypothetical protein
MNAALSALRTGLVLTAAHSELSADVATARFKP